MTQASGAATPGERDADRGHDRPRAGAGPAPSLRERLYDRSEPTTLRAHRLGYRQVWPRPSPSDLREFYARSFYDEASPAYLEKGERERAYWDATWSLRRELMEEALPPDRRRLLDIGASGGQLLDHFRRHGWEVHGVEPSHSAVEWARHRHGLELFCGELLDYLPDPASRFDAIHCAQVLEHVLDPEACVSRIAELLAPGGVAFIEVPNDFNAFQEAAREALDKDAWWVVPKLHLNYFDADSLSALLDEHGLTPEDRLASFPMEIFLLMGEDYVGHPDVGSACHAKRMRFERTLFERDRSETLRSFYRALGHASLGRTCGVLARRPA